MEEIFCKDTKELRNWLELNHTLKDGIWLVFYIGEKRTMSWSDIVEELLCFGWIDSKGGKIDSQKSKLWIAPRNEKSNWSAKNKNHVEKLIKEGRMTEHGMKMIDLAKENGTWNALDQVESLEIPDDLLEELQRYSNAYQNFNSFPKSARRGILEWILNAKTPETRLKRITETAKLADENIRANQYLKKKPA